MRKIICFLLLSLGLQAQIVSIPDANFKAKLLASSPSNFTAKNLSGHYFKIDSNSDNEIQLSEALQVYSIQVENSSISSLEGIQYFTNLGSLSCSYNQISNLNLINLSNLSSLSCDYNQINSLTINNLSHLRVLTCSNNQIISLNMSGCPHLNQLNCSYNNISTLIFPNPHPIMGYSFWYLNCQNNQLTSLVLNNFRNLQTLYCNNNLLSSISITYSPYLSDFNCSNNQLLQLNTSNLISLEVLKCYNNYLTELDVNSNKGLNYLICSNNQIQFLKLKNGRNIQTKIFNNNSNLKYICCDLSRISSIQDSASQNGYGFPSVNVEVNSYCNFKPGEYFYTIQGNNKFDVDSNGCGQNDNQYPNLKYTILDGTNSQTLVSNVTGGYNISVINGTTITPQLENPTYFNVSPSTIQVSFPATASPFNQNFCITPNGVHHDVEVTLIPTTPARPGFNATYKMIYKNKGNQVENGAVTLTYLNQDALDIVSCNPAFNSENSDGFEKTLTWNYVNLQPFETREITVILNLNGPMETPALNIGETLSMTSTVTPEINDETPIDNHSSIRQVIVGSYDPNDKKCIEGATITPAMVGEYVHYVIRFENTGTYPAQNVVVKDMIDLAKFDIATLLPIKASHNFETRIAGNKVEFIFENINLPFDDANNDGYVAFKIKTKPTLVLGDTFSNQANIYFDYNFPIITNTATTTIAALSTTDFEFGTHFTLYPNPVKDVLNFQSKDNTSIHSIEIYTTLGQVVLAVTDTLSTVDVSSLQAGNYFIKVHTDLGVSNTKFIKE